MSENKLLPKMLRWESIIDSFVASIVLKVKTAYDAEPLDGDETQDIADTILIKLDKAFANE